MLVQEESARLLFALLVAALVLLAAYLVVKIVIISRNRRYYDIEIGRTDGHERAYWIRRKKRAWRSLIPFYDLLHQ